MSTPLAACKSDISHIPTTGDLSNMFRATVTQVNATRGQELRMSNHTIPCKSGISPHRPSDIRQRHWLHARVIYVLAIQQGIFPRKSDTSQRRPRARVAYVKPYYSVQERDKSTPGPQCKSGLCRQPIPCNSYPAILRSEQK